MTTRKKPTPKTQEHSRRMTEEHKEAIRVGRRQSAAVGAYLEALDSTGSIPTNDDQLNQRLSNIEQKMASANRIEKLRLTQDRLDIHAELNRRSVARANAAAISDLEAAFVEVAADYSARTGIGYQAFREQGVPASLLKAAGIKP